MRLTPRDRTALALLLLAKLAGGTALLVGSSHRALGVGLLVLAGALIGASIALSLVGMAER